MGNAHDAVMDTVSQTSKDVASSALVASSQTSTMKIPLNEKIEIALLSSVVISFTFAAWFVVFATLYTLSRVLPGIWQVATKAWTFVSSAASVFSKLREITVFLMIMTAAAMYVRTFGLPTDWTTLPTMQRVNEMWSLSATVFTDFAWQVVRLGVKFWKERQQ